MRNDPKIAAPPKPIPEWVMTYESWKPVANCTTSMLGPQRALNSQRSNKRTRNIISSMEGLKSNNYIPSRKLGVEVVNDLVTFLLPEETDLTLIPQNDYSRLPPHPTPRLNHYPSLQEMSQVLYGLLTSMLSVEDHVRF